jgi:CO dehydrogenase/acetyl-CoA synthase delta subunit
MIDADLKELFTQLALAQAKTDERHTKFESEMADINAKADERFAKFEAKMAALNIKADERQARAEERSARVDEQIARTNKQLGGMAQSQGDVAEEYFYNSLVVNPQIGDIRFDIIDQNSIRTHKNIKQEFDIVLINGGSVAIVEVKYKACLKDIEQLFKQIESFKVLYPEYKNYKLYAGLASLCVPNEVTEQAQKQGLFVLQQVGNVLSQHTQNMRAH